RCGDRVSLGAWTTAIQDDLEGVSMLAARVPGYEGTVRAPDYVPEADRDAWRLGHEASLTCSDYGDRWRKLAWSEGFAATSFQPWARLLDGAVGEEAGDGR
ncbi:MAG: hypothetical protein AAFR54_23090, partial [Planctomycetota bacterium]